MTGIALVTGASGFLGSNLVDRLVGEGWDVRGLVRDPSRAPEKGAAELFHSDLPDSVDEAAFDEVDVVIHCAYMSRHTTLEEARRVNEEGSKRILALSRSHGARFVFISSTGAHPEALSYYGQSKLSVERTLDPDRDLIIRPGLILGEGGLFRRVVDSLARFGFVPVFDGGRQRIQTVHVEDLSEAIVRAIGSGLTGTYVVADPEAHELRQLFRAMAARMGRRCRLVPLPSTPMLLLLRAAERMGMRLPLSSENVLGALSLRPQESSTDVQAIGVRVRGMEESLDDLLRTRRS